MDTQTGAAYQSMLDEQPKKKTKYTVYGLLGTLCVGILL